MNINGNPATIVFYGTGAIDVHSNLNQGTETCQSLINRIVYNLEYTVMKAPFMSISNIHVRAFSNTF